MKQWLLVLGLLTHHRMPRVYSWHKCVHGTMTIRNQNTYTTKTIKNQRKRKVETQHYTKLILRVTDRNPIHDIHLLF